MARKSPKCPPTVEPNQSGCTWNFSGMFDHHHHHHGRPQRKLLSFDEQLRSINIESKKKQSLKEETSSSNHTTMEKSFWKKIKSRYETPNKKKENPIYNSIVVLKPSQRVIESPVDVGCVCSYLHSHHKSSNNQQIVKQNRVSINDVRKKLKNAKKVKKKNTRKGSEPGQNDENAPRTEKLQLVPFLKQEEPDVFVEARRHLAERLKQVVKGECEGEASSSTRVSRTLERVLLSSPIHMSIATFYREIEDICVEKSLLTMDSDPNIEAMEANECMEVSQMEMALDVSSPKVNFKLENMENDQFRENPSPVSVLESIFADNISSPTSTIESSVEHHIQPQCLDFEEHSQTSSPSHQKTSLSSFMEDRGLISAYVKEIYEASESNWEDFLATDYSELSCDHKLRHDCVKEVLIGLNMRIMFVSSKIRAFSLEEDVVNEVMEQIEWHNGQIMIPRTLDNLVRRDIAKGGEWVHVADGNDVVFEVVDETLQVLIMEAISDILV